jgi:beta-lysine N6-acetyltransferase
MTEDFIENIGGSIIQHGHHNNRIYLVKLNTDNVQHLIAMLDDMALGRGYGKIFAKVPEPAWNDFESAGYTKEAVVPGYVLGKTDGYFIAKYFSAERERPEGGQSDWSPTRRFENRFASIYQQAGKSLHAVFPCKPSDAKEMSSVYQRTFKSYPFPIQRPAYLKQVMRKDTLYFGIRINNKIVALAGVEIDLVNRNVEMTDFATLPRWRGKGFAQTLLSHMDGKVRELGIKTAYTIARAKSDSMNLVFGKSGYRFAGLLKNNSHISGGIQDMTVWYKQF